MNRTQAGQLAQKAAYLKGKVIVVKGDPYEVLEFKMDCVTVKDGTHTGKENCRVYAVVENTFTKKREAVVLQSLCDEFPPEYFQETLDNMHLDS